jgi:hypothetical protein
MVPSSAVIRAPTRPTSTMAVRTGPSSRTTLATTMLPRMYSGMAPVNWYPPCWLVTIPARTAVTITMGMLWTPIT